ncbi:MAG TPA: adenylyltransferase/cytidyltransferase family protein [Acidobacteriota bacterium]|nr:adenylyltransferase/cytidyltransferase family protein [Acidobacteriota bacterium]
MGLLIGREEAAALAERLREEGRTVVLANGAFDPLHVGHVRYLKAAKECGDTLFVALNSDSSVRGLKGPGRPVITQDERAEILCALEPVGYVLIFDEPTVEQVIRALRPDFHCKGTDYTPGSVPEAELVRSLGGEVRIVGDPKNHDSSAMIRKIKTDGADGK